MRMSDTQCGSSISLPLCCILRLISYRQSAWLSKDECVFPTSLPKNISSQGNMLLWFKLLAFAIFTGPDTSARQEMQPQTDTCMDYSKQHKPWHVTVSAAICFVGKMFNWRKIS